jgi:hypothetical protein
MFSNNGYSLPVPSEGTSSFKPLANPGWIAPAIEHSVNKHGVFSTAVVNRKRKALREQAVILAEEDAVDARVELQRIDV